MKYRSFNYQGINPTQKNNPSKGLSKNIRVKFILSVLGIVAALFTFKLVVTPIVSALVYMVKESSATISYLITRQGLKKDEQGYSNFLLLGIDQRGVGSSILTDTIMILRYNESTNKVYMISLPRDLWVKIPVFGQVQSYYTKINSVYTIGNDYEYSSDSDKDPQNGLGLLSKIIKDDLAISIHYATQVNFNSFERIIDAVGGIDIDVENTFTDYMYPCEGYEKANENERYGIVSFKVGMTYMNGETALKYARSRHSIGIEGSDFARARRQQKVVLAMKDKLLQNETLLNLNTLKEIYLTVSQEVDSNVRPSEFPMFYDIFKKVGSNINDIKLIVLNDGPDEGGLLYSPDPNEYGGAFVLLPRVSWLNLQLELEKLITQE